MLCQFLLHGKLIQLYIYITFPGGTSGKEPAGQCMLDFIYVGLIPGLGRSPGRGNGNPPIFLPGESHGQRNLAGCSPQGCTELDMAEAT